MPNDGKYELIIPNKKRNTYEYFALFILLLNIFLFGWWAIGSTSIFNKWVAIVGTAILVTLLFIKKKNIKAVKRFSALGTSFVMATVTWLLLREFLPAIITALLFVLYLVAIRKLVVKVQPLNISYPSFPQKMIYWKELSNVILKEGLLTIDFKSNKLIQQVIEENKSYVNEQEFNDFCKSMLKEKGGIDRIKADHC